MAQETVTGPAHEQSLAVTGCELQTADAILNRIDAVVFDDDQYQEDETRPADEVVTVAKNFIEAIQAEGVSVFPKANVTVYFGEVDLTWKTQRDLVRLIVRPSGRTDLYIQPDYQDSPKGEMSPVTAADSKKIAGWIRWLLRG